MSIIYLENKSRNVKGAGLQDNVSIKWLGHAILGKRQIGRARVFHLQNHDHVTNGNDVLCI